MNEEAELIELRGIPGEIVWQGPREITFGELIPVEGATAKITLAYLPSCAARSETLNFHLDFRNTSTVPVSIRPVIYFIREPEAPFRAWGSQVAEYVLGPQQSFSDKYGKYWLGGIGIWGTLVIHRVEAAIEVYTPEGWIEADRVAGEPFEWWSSIPVPEITSVMIPVEGATAAPGQYVHVLFQMYNPGYTNPPSSGYKVDAEEGWMGRQTHPPDTYCTRGFNFIMGYADKTITITPYRISAPCTAEGCTERYGKPVSVTIRSTVVTPRYTLAVAVDGEGTVDPPGGEFEKGTVVELTAYPAEGWFFHSWEGTDNNSANPTSVTMYSDRHVVCNFTQVPPEERRDPLDNFIRTMEDMRPKCPVGAIEKAWVALTEKVIEITPAIKILPPTKGGE